MNLQSVLDAVCRRLIVLMVVAGLAPNTSAQSIAFDADVSSVAVDPRNPSRIYASTRGGLLKTDDRGSTWEQLPVFPLGRRQPSFAQVEFDLNNTSVIYALAYGQSSDRLVGAWRSSNRGISWQRIVEPGTFPASSQLIRILVAPSNGSVLYAVLRIGTAQSTYRSGDGGVTWARAGDRGALSVSTGSADTLYGAIGTDFLRSTDGGRTWLQTAQLTSASSLSVINAIAASPSDPNLLVAATSGPSSGVGIFRSTNGGGTWGIVQGGGAIGVKFNVLNPSLVVVGDCCGLGGFYSNDSGLSFRNYSAIIEGSTARVSTTLSNVSFDYSQMGALMVGLGPTRGGGGVAAQNGPAGIWRKLPGTYTPTAVAEVFLESGQMLSGDSSEARTVVDIVAAEGGSAAGFVIGNPASVGPGTSARIIANPPVPNGAPQSVVVSRSAQALNAGTYNTTVSLPVTGALNRELTIEGTMEVVDQPQVAGVSLELSLGRNFTESILSMAAGNGKIYLGTASRLYSFDGKGGMEVIAGTGSTGFSGDGGPATRAQVSRITQVAVSTDGTIHFHDSFNRRIRRIAPNGTISTLAGNPSGALSITEGASLNSISFSGTTKLAVRANGEVLVGHSNRIWRIDGNSFRTVAGGGSGSPQNGSLATGFSLFSNSLFTVDPQNAIVFSDNGRLFRILPNNTLQLLAGAEVNRDIPGSRNAREVRLFISAFVVGLDGVYLFDGLTNTIQRVNLDATIETVALNGMIGPASGCTGALYAPAAVAIPTGLALAPDGSLLLADSSLKRFWIPRSGATPGVRPVVTPEGVVNAASLTRALAPGSLASIFGANLTASTAAASALPLPAELGGGVACLAGQVAPIAFASPSQLNVQIPFGLVPGTHSLRAFNAAGGTVAVPVNLQTTSPEIFRANGRAVVINPDGSLNQTDRGVAAGQVIVAYLTGIGEVAPALETGSASPSNPLALPAGATSATVGGMNAPLLFLGMSPGFVGLAQANVQIPALAAGEHDLVLRVGGQASEALAITVQ